MNYRQHFISKVLMEITEEGKKQRFLYCPIGDGATSHVLCDFMKDSPLSPRLRVNVLRLIKWFDGISKPTSLISLPLTHLMSGCVMR